MHTPSFARMTARGAAISFSALLALCLVAGTTPAPAEEPEQVSCPKDTERKGKRPPQGRKEWCDLPDGTQHGPSVSYYASGMLMASAVFDKGELDGEYRAWHPNGQLAEAGMYSHDQRRGVFRTWDPNGSQLTEETHEDGQIHGKSRIWFPNGQLMLEMTYSKGRRDGPAVTFYNNGQKRTEGEFRNDAYHGTWRGWYADGSLEKVAEFDDGRELSRKTFPRGSGGDG
jgi:antitoxin component YwqK of YwqJK toxin-antitoxin module